jgi:GH18 family chitinase
MHSIRQSDLIHFVQTAPQDNVYGGSLTGFSTDSAIKWYLAQGATPSKINLGMPLYGHAFEDTNGMGSPYNGVRLRWYYEPFEPLRLLFRRSAQGLFRQASIATRICR